MIELSVTSTLSTFVSKYVGSVLYELV